MNPENPPLGHSTEVVKRLADEYAVYYSRGQTTNIKLRLEEIRTALHAAIDALAEALKPNKQSGSEGETP